MVLYIIRCEGSERFYIGITNSVKRRIATHKHAAKSKKSPLYNWMRKYPDWEMHVACDYEDRIDAESDEIFWIDFGRNNQWKLLNLADGGDGGYVVPECEKDDWKAKLRLARVGGKPALGMKHTEANKVRMSEASLAYWATQDTYSVDDIKGKSFKEANISCGISHTHYYRLKRSLSNDQ